MQLSVNRCKFFQFERIFLYLVSTVGEETKEMRTALPHFQGNVLHFRRRKSHLRFQIYLII